MPSVANEIMSGQRNILVNKPVVTSATSSSKTTSQESSSEFQRNVRVDDTAKMSFKDTHIQGKIILFVKDCFSLRKQLFFFALGPKWHSGRSKEGRLFSQAMGCLQCEQNND